MEISENGGLSFRKLPDIPYASRLYGACVVIIDEERVFIAGGIKSRDYSCFANMRLNITPCLCDSIPETDEFYTNTAFLNLTSNVWTTGPSLTNARYYHTCSLVTLDSGEKEIVVVGGVSTADNCTQLRDVEIINLDTNVVRAGK